MTADYSKAIIDCAVDKLNSSSKPLSEPQMVSGIVHRLKQLLGKEDKRHSAKGRFKKDSFKYIIETASWKKVILQLPDKKFVLAKNFAIHVDKLRTDNQWNWQNCNINDTKRKVLSVLGKLHSYKFEHLVREVVSKAFPDVTFEVTVATKDFGIDIYGLRIDPDHKNKKEIICIQVKKHSRTVGRPEADKFVGAVRDILEKNNSDYSKFHGLFITTAKYPESFRNKLSSSCKTGQTFDCWDGDELVTRMISLGMGVCYSIDTSFWNEIDPALIPKVKKTN